MQMQTYDMIMLAVMLAAIVFGAWKGLAWQIASLSAIFVSYFVAYQLREPVSQYINVGSPWDRILAMLGVYLFVSLIIWIIFGYVRKIIDRVKLQDFDRHAGAVLGAVKGVILCMIITLFAVALLGENQKEKICCSYSGYVIAKVIDRIKDVLHPYLEKLDSELGHNHTQRDESQNDVPPTESEPASPSGFDTARKLLDAAEESFNSKR